MHLPSQSWSISVREGALLFVAVSQSIALAVLFQRIFHLRKCTTALQQTVDREKKLRNEERVGRITCQKRVRQSMQTSQHNEGYNFKQIGHIESPFPGRCGTPRQPNLVSAAKGRIVFDKKLIQLEHYKELADFSHIWVVWVFHENTNIDSAGLTPAKIAPPRLGGRRVNSFFRIYFFPLKKS